MIKRIEIKAGRWAWFGEEHGKLRKAPFRDLFADLERLEEHNPVLCLKLGSPSQQSSDRDMRLTDLGLDVSLKELKKALERLPAGLGVIDHRAEIGLLRLVLGRKGAAAGSDGPIDPEGRTVLASAQDTPLQLLPCAENCFDTVFGPGGSKAGDAQLKAKDGTGRVLTALCAKPLGGIRLWDIRPGVVERSGTDEEGLHDASDGCALIVLDALQKKLRAALKGYGCEADLKAEGKNPVDKLDAVIAGTEPKFWFGEVRNAYMPPGQGLARHLEKTYGRLLRRKGSRFLFWRTRRLAAAMRRAGLDVPSKITKGLARLRKPRAEARDDG